MIKAIIFDCFGVLTGDKWKEFVGSLPKDQKEPARVLSRALDSGILGHDQFYKQIFELTGRQPEEVEGIINAEMHKNTPLLSYIANLKRNYKIGLLSNISSNWIRDSFLNAEETALFDDMVFSYQVGTVKPDPRIFEVAAQNLGVDFSECVFVDDGIGNCEGAKRVGMHTVLYQDYTQLKSELEQLLHQA